jgi:hypothetical protein
MAKDPRKKLCFPYTCGEQTLELLVREISPNDIGWDLLKELGANLEKDHTEAMDDIRALLKKLTPRQRKIFERIIFEAQQGAVLAGQKYEYASQSLAHGMKRSGKRPTTERKHALIRKHLLKMTGLTDEERVSQLFVEYQRGRKLSQEWEQQFGDDFPSHSTIRGAVNPKKLKFDSASAYGVVISILDSDPTE